MSGVRDSQSYGDFTYAGAIGFLDDKLRVASPSGLAANGGRLFFTDNEACSVRGINLIEGYSSTLLGGSKGNSLFKPTDNNIEIRDQKIVDGFGDVDSSSYKARMSYPSALCNDGTDSLLLCDTMNNKIKIITVSGTKNANIKTLTKVNNKINEKSLLAPQGIVSVSSTNKKNAAKAGDFIVSDTGNNRLLYVQRGGEESGDGGEVTELVLDFSIMKSKR